METEFQGKDELRCAGCNRPWEACPCSPVGEFPTRSDIDGLLARRAAARQAGDWPMSDALRDQLRACRITVEDTPTGQIANGGTEHELRRACAQLDQANRTINDLIRKVEVMAGRAEQDRMTILRQQNELLKRSTPVEEVPSAPIEEPALGPIK